MNNSNNTYSSPDKDNLFNEEISKLPASATLILLSPDKNLLKGEMRQIISHIDSGINFVWFLNSKKLDYENELSEYLGIKISNNTIESKRSVNLNMSKDFTIPKQVNKFGSLNDFNGTILLPFTRIIKQNTLQIVARSHFCLYHSRVCLTINSVKIS